MRVAAAVTLIIGVSRHSICSTAISDVSWITSTRDKTTTIARCVTMYRDITKRQGSSTQIPLPSLSATTLSVAQLASHSHNLNGGAFIGNGSGGDYSGQVQWASSGFRAFNTTANTGSNWSHSHGISNPAHSHTAQSTSIKLMPPAKALHYIMRIA